MSFSGPADFFAMGGHGLYVWLAYGAALIIALYNVISVRMRQRRALQMVRDRLRRQRAVPADSAGAGAGAAAVVTGESER